MSWSWLANKVSRYSRPWVLWWWRLKDGWYRHWVSWSWLASKVRKYSRPWVLRIWRLKNGWHRHWINWSWLANKVSRYSRPWVLRCWRLKKGWHRHWVSWNWLTYKVSRYRYRYSRLPGTVQRLWRLRTYKLAYARRELNWALPLCLQLWRALQLQRYCLYFVLKLFSWRPEMTETKHKTLIMTSLSALA